MAFGRSLNYRLSVKLQGQAHKGHIYPILAQSLLSLSAASFFQLLSDKAQGVHRWHQANQRQHRSFCFIQFSSPRMSRSDFVQSPVRERERDCERLREREVCDMCPEVLM